MTSTLPALALLRGCIESLTQVPWVDVVQEQQHDLRLAVPIEQLAIGGLKIADVQLLDRRGFPVTGRKQGSTSLLTWTGYSPEPLHSLVKVEGCGSVDTRGAPAFTAGAMEELPNQMQTDVRFVEVSRSKLKQANTSFVQRDGDFWVLGAPGSPDDIKVNTDGSGLGDIFGTGNSGFNLIFGGGKWLSFINALEGSGFAYTLACPNLVAVDGQSASFLADDEFPIPVPSGTDDNVTIEYKEFGIRLTLTPTVMNNRRIALKVAPEVNGLDYSTGIQSGRMAVPALRVRRTDTSVVLADGESFVISGLTSNNSVNNVDKFPWLGDIPILGAFFRSTKLGKDDRELLMIVTPHLVQSLATGTQLPDLPGEGLRHYDPGLSRLYFLERGEYDGQQDDTGLSDQETRVNQNLVALVQHPDELDWLQNNLASADQVVPVGSASLGELLALFDITAAGMLFIGFGRSNLVSQGALAEGLVSAWPMLSVTAVGDGLNNQLVLTAMRAGAHDFITYGARTSELTGLIRHLGGHPPSVPASVVRQGKLLALIGARPDVDGAFVTLHLTKALQEQTLNQVLLLDVGQPTGKVLAILGLNSTFTFGDILRDLWCLDQTLIDNTSARLDNGLQILNLTDEPGVLERVTATKLYLLLGDLRGTFGHVVVDLTGPSEGELSSQLLVQANRMLWIVDRNVPSYKKGLGRLHRLCERNLPLPSVELLIERCLPNVAPGQQALSRTFDLDLFGALPLSPESRLRTKNLDRNLFEMAPRDPLVAKLQQLTDSLCVIRGERRSLLSWLGRAKAALL